MQMNHSTQPYFDMELFLQTAETTRLDGVMLENCIERWQQWCPHIKSANVHSGSDTILALWLDIAVENDVDAAWSASPSEGFLLNALAQTLCMCAVHERVPEVEDAGCAPSPKPSADLAKALSDAGLPAQASPALQLGRKYAVVTPFPFKGGCEICALQQSCPRSGNANDAVFELPGYE